MSRSTQITCQEKKTGSCYKGKFQLTTATIDDNINYIVQEIDKQPSQEEEER